MLLALVGCTFRLLAGEDATGYRKEALAFSQSKQWDRAIADYRKALALEPNDAETHYDLALVNAKGVFFTSQAVLPIMIAQKRGVIVSLASMAGKIGSRANLPYNASKAAVISMTKSLALAHAADGIRVNCVCPGFVETDLWAAVARVL
jgi:NAD(P)-dependent dehydrogenase (short-subunit alcohol dehydrogenase family)